MLDKILAKLPPQAKNPNLLVGVETGDDSAVYKINDDQAIVATTDFFMPIVDDPYEFGRIAATNALSDVWAIGGQPLLALAIAGFPANGMDLDMVGQILAGGAATCAEAGVPVAGGHTIDNPEPIYGLAVVGLVHPDKIKRNADGRAGDKLILGKGLGVGILGAALNKNELDDAGYKVMIEATTKLNRVGADLAQMPEVHALTDCTGFGLLGHLMELCRGANVQAYVDLDKLPILPTVLDYAKKGYNTGAANRNWESFEADIQLPGGIEAWQKNLLMDPQTAGGLMTSCPADAVDAVITTFKKAGFDDACVIGELAEGAPKVTVR